MKNTLEEHPGIATVGVIIIAVGVVLLLSFLSTRSPSKRSQPIFAHGQQGPVEQLPADQRRVNDQTGEPATDSEGTDTPGDPAAGTPAAGQTTDIRQIDFNSVLTGELGGGASLEQTLYADLDGSGSPEALVLIRGEGDNRPLAWKVFTEDNGSVRLLFERSGASQGELMIDGPRVVETEGVFAEGDQPCCPSSLKKTYYVWKSGRLVVSKVELQPAP